MNDEIKSLVRKHGCEWTSSPNALLIPVLRLVYRDEDIDVFNAAYAALSVSPLPSIVRSSSGGISNAIPLSKRIRRWDLRKNGETYEMTIIINEGMLRIQICNGKPSSEMSDHAILSGRQAFFRFKKICLKDGICLDDFAGADGEEISKNIEKPIICFHHPALVQDKVFNNVFHVDFRNSYPAGLVNTHAEFKEPVTWLFNHRDQNPEYKDILNLSIGFMHSKFSGYKFAILASDAIKDSNDRVRELAQRIEAAGYTILLYNTDGFYYFGKKEAYHGEGEGDGLGNWHNDLVGLKWRAKSVGAYEYQKPDGSYKAVVRGLTPLDSIKPRGSWEWGDIYRNECVVNRYTFKEKIGFIKRK